MDEVEQPSNVAAGPVSSGIRVTIARSEQQSLEGERKTLTALFADIKGSTELMRDLDPEEARAIVDPVLHLMMAAVHRYGGYVAQSRRPEEGLQVVEDGFACSAKTGEQLSNPSLHQVKGELLLAQNPSAVAEAERCFRTAIEIARRQSARSAELRATMSLARLLASQGRRDEARAMLAEIYGWFTEGFDTADLKDAKALLHELSA